MNKKPKFKHSRLLSAQRLATCGLPDAGDEIYCSGVFCFNVSAMLEWLARNPLPAVNVPVDTWGRFDCKNAHYVESADVERPILIAEIAPDYRDFVPDVPEDDWISRGYVCIDGQHRIEKALRLGIKLLPAIVLRMEQHIPFLYKGYEHYVEYWNGKLKDRVEDALSWKRSVFKALAEDVSKCNVCSNAPTKPHSLESECLENDGHGLNTSTPYVNLWNLWNGSLNADIMVIGQDFGQRGEPRAFVEAWRSGTYKNATDVALRHLIQNAFKIDVDKNSDALFFTNMANCYRKQKATGSSHSCWLPICAHKYMARLIRIVRPKIIIVLGQIAFEALFCMDGLKVECINPDNASAETLAARMKYSYQISIDKSYIRVFPVYHPGANSKRNRGLVEQEKDWKRIAEYYETVR